LLIKLLNWSLILTKILTKVVDVEYRANGSLVQVVGLVTEFWWNLWFCGAKCCGTIYCSVITL